jgi:hypothetical protein
MAAVTDLTIYPGGGSWLQNALNTTIADVRELCLLLSVNKWSLRKPMDWGPDRYWSLSDAEMVGPDNLTRQGYYYGIKFSDNSFTTISAIHTSGITLFDYYRLQTGSYARLDDFYNYDPEATADISMDKSSIPSSISESGSLSVRLIVNKSQYGVPFSEVMSKVIQGGIGEGSYLMMLVSKAANVGSASVGYHSFTRLSESPIDFNTNAITTYSLRSIPRAGDYVISFFLYIPRNSAELNAMPDVGEYIDAFEVLLSSQPVVIPEGHRHSLTITPIGNIPIATSMRLAATTFAVSATVELNSSVSGDFRLEASGTINGISVRDVFISTTANFAWALISPGSLPATGQPVNATLTFRCSIDGGNTWGSPAQFSGSTVITG